jgi:hypothetical protein
MQVGADDLAGVSDKTHLGNRARHPRLSSGRIAVLRPWEPDSDSDRRLRRADDRGFAPLLGHSGTERECDDLEHWYKQQVCLSQRDDRKQNCVALLRAAAPRTFDGRLESIAAVRLQESGARAAIEDQGANAF